jgi:Galactose-3-O-sulfotransferase
MLNNVPTEQPRRTQTGHGDQAVVFLHIKKTGGVTLDEILYREYPKETTHQIKAPLRETVAAFEQLPKEARARIRLLTGHVHYGIHEYLSPPTTYITLLRDPLERVLSFYYSIRRKPGHPLHEAVAGRMSLTDFVTSGLSNQPDNGMVRVLAGRSFQDIPFGATHPKMLEAALEHIASHFEVVGTTERFDESLVLMHQALGWKRLPRYVHRNVTAQRPHAKSLTKQERSTIEGMNQLDRALYEEVVRSLDERIRTGGVGFDRVLRRFRRVNGVYGRAYTASAPLRFVRRRVIAAATRRTG